MSAFHAGGAAMQCPSCSFENVPGLPVCARCQSVLCLDQVSVVPRRASGLRLATRASRAWYRLRGRVGWAGCLLPRWRPLVFAPLPWSALAWTVLLPGLGSVRVGHRRLGGTLMAAWLACLLLALVTIAGPWNNWWLALAIAAHAAAFIALFAGNLAFEWIVVRMLFGALLFAGLQFGLYGPLGGLGRCLVVPLELTEFLPGPLLAPGDGILYQGSWLRSAAYARGDLVVYAIQEDRGSGIYVRAGLGLDRVLGLPGEHIRLRSHTITINGAPLPPGVAPLGRVPPLPDLDVTLGDGEYLILPSRLQLRLNAHAREEALVGIIGRVMVVRDSAVLGRVLCRVRPWRHLGVVK
jgi:hypothetical protein